MADRPIADIVADLRRHKVTQLVHPGDLLAVLDDWQRQADEVSLAKQILRKILTECDYVELDPHYTVFDGHVRLSDEEFQFCVGLAFDVELLEDFE